MSNGDIRRLCEQSGVLINGEKVSPQEDIDFLYSQLYSFQNQLPNELPYHEQS